MGSDINTHSIYKLITFKLLLNKWFISKGFLSSRSEILQTVYNKKHICCNKTTWTRTGKLLRVGLQNEISNKW